MLLLLSLLFADIVAFAAFPAVVVPVGIAVAVLLAAIAAVVAAAAAAGIVVSCHCRVWCFSQKSQEIKRAYEGNRSCD